MLGCAGVRSARVRDGLGALITLALVLLALVGPARAEPRTTTGMDVGEPATSVGRIERADRAPPLAADDLGASGPSPLMPRRPLALAPPGPVAVDESDASGRSAHAPIESVGPRGPPR